MSNPNLTLDILKRWTTRQMLADDVQKNIVVIHRWFQRKSIPSKYDAVLLDAAARRNIALSWRELMDARKPHTDQLGHAEAASQPVRLDNSQGKANA